MPRRNSGPKLIFLKERNCFYVRWYDRGRSRRRSTGTSDVGEANRFLAEFLAEYFDPASSRGPVAPANYPIAEALELYCREHAPNTGDPERIGYAVKALLKFWGNLTVGDITKPTCARYARASGKAPGTTRRELGTLQAAINLAHSEGLVTSAPKVTLPPRPPGKERWLRRTEVAALLKAARQTESKRYLPLFIVLALYTGARKQAILSLRWPQVDLERGLINFNPPGRAQTKKRRAIVPISKRLLYLLRSIRRNGSDLGYVVNRGGQRVKDIKHGFKSAAKRAGLTDVTAHTLRHTCGTWLAQRGVSMWEISRFLGHTSVRTTDLYAHHSPEFLKEASNALGRK
jgi:integrase